MENWRTNIKGIISELEEGMVDVFRHLHMYPELSFQEFETTKFIEEELRKLDIEILDIGLETGVVGLLKGAEDGPCIGLRADIDGLPVEETADYEYKSQINGRMHACGHDTHTASLLGAAKVLAAMRGQIKGSVKFLFQPAEEVNKGALVMLEKEAMENPKVDAVFGLHNSPEIPVGTVAVKQGGLMAAVHCFYITLHGKGGHGGVPHRNHDPVVGAAAAIQSLQTIMSREASPLHPGVLSICSVHAGEGLTYNVTPEVVKMVGTCRTYDRELGDKIEGSMRRILDHTAAAYNLTAELEYNYDLPVVSNPALMMPIAEDAVKSIGAEPVNPDPSTGGEDFTFFMEKAPGFFYWLGVRNEEKGFIHPWHSPNFQADEGAIGIGAGVYAASVFSALEAFENGLLSQERER